MNKNSKEDYKKSVKTLRNILNGVDPEGFAPGQEDGTPIDEYDAEAAKIYNFVIHNLEEIKLNNNLLVDEINKIWLESFRKACDSAKEITSRVIKSLF